MRLRKKKKKKELLKMGRQRENPQWKGIEKELSEIEASNPSDIEFKTMVIRMLKDLSENFKELQGSFKELNWNYTSMKKRHRKFQ